MYRHTNALTMPCLRNVPVPQGLTIIAIHVLLHDSVPVIHSSSHALLLHIELVVLRLQLLFERRNRKT